MTVLEAEDAGVQSSRYAENVDEFATSDLTVKSEPIIAVVTPEGGLQRQKSTQLREP